VRLRIVRAVGTVHIFPSIFALSVLITCISSVFAFSRFPPEYTGKSVYISKAEERQVLKDLDAEKWKQLLSDMFSEDSSSDLRLSSLFKNIRSTRGYQENVKQCFSRRLGWSRLSCEVRTLKSIWILGRISAVFDDFVFLRLMTASRKKHRLEFEKNPELENSLEQYESDLNIVRALSQNKISRPSHETDFVFVGGKNKTARVHLYETYSPSEIVYMGKLADAVMFEMNSEKATATFSSSSKGEKNRVLSLEQKTFLAKSFLDEDLRNGLKENRLTRIPSYGDVFASALETGVISSAIYTELKKLPQFRKEELAKEHKQRRRLSIAYKIGTQGSLFVPVYGPWIYLLLSAGEIIYAKNRKNHSSYSP